MSYLRFIFNLFKYLIVDNPIKVMLIVLSIIFFNFIDKFEGEWERHDVVVSGKHGNDFIYVIQSSQTTNGYDIIKSEKEMVIKNGQISLWDYNDVNILFWILFVVSSGAVVVGTIVGIISDDDDISWDFIHCYTKSLSSLIYCELEDGIYYYMIMGRLITKSENIIRSSNIAANLNIFRFSDIYILPKFSTKNQKRENNLEKLGIK